MTTATAKKANRGHLLRACKAGRLWVKCSFHLTDDYAFDNATGFGKADAFRKTYLAGNPPAAPEGTDHIEKDRLYREFRSEEEREHPGEIRLYPNDFRGKSGHCWGTTESGNFSVHSNLNYKYEIR